MIITKYDPFVAEIAKVRAAANFLPDASSKDGYEKSKRISLDVGKILSRLDKIRKEEKAFYLEGCRQVDEQAKDIRSQLEAIQSPHKRAYKELDETKKKAEAKRKSILEKRLCDIINLPQSMAESDSEGVKQAMQAMQADECLGFYEFTHQALLARKNSLESLAALFARKVKHEADQAELDRLRKESTERDRVEREEKIKSEALELAKKELEAKASKAADEARKEAEKKLREAEEAKMEAESARIQAEKQAKEEQIESARKLKEAQDRAALDAENAAKAERKRIENKLEIKRQADQKIVEAESKRKQEVEHRTMIEEQAIGSLVERGWSDSVAREIIYLVICGSIENVTINY